MRRFANSTRRPFRTVFQAMLATCRRPLRAGVAKVAGNKWSKCYHTEHLALALIGRCLLGIDSCRQLNVELTHNLRFAKLTGLGNVSISQLPKLLHQRSADFWPQLVAHLIRQLQPKQLPQPLRLMDTTFFAMGYQLFSRSFEKTCTPHTAGYKAGFVFDPDAGLPLRIVCRAGQSNDAEYLDALVPPQENIAGQVLIFDRGFRKYSFFDEVITRQADFITRACAQVHYEVVASILRDPEQPQIISDERIILGCPDHYQLEHQVRRIVVQRDDQTCVFLSSCLDLSAVQVADMYARRWEIETFFRWLKRVLNCQRPLAYSTQATAHTIYSVLVAYLLFLLLDREQFTVDGKTSLRGLKTHWHRLTIRLWHTATDEELRCLGFL